MNTIREQLERWQTNEEKLDHQSIQETGRSRQSQPERALPPPRLGPFERVVGGVVKWKPIDQTAARVVAKAPWWAQLESAPAPKAVETEPRKQRRKGNKKMKGDIAETGHKAATSYGTEANSSYVSKSGLLVRMVNGEPMLSVEDVRAIVVKEIEECPRLINPSVKAAEDARRILDELFQGLGRDMELFKAGTKLYIEDIRQSRFAIVTETASMTHSLKDVRQFFLGSDYKEQIERLREFVDLCERLQKLKAAGFLDAVADTMLRLSV